MRAKDHTGKTFGFLTVIKQVESVHRGKRRDARWLCRCVCGNEKEITAKHLVQFMIQSCGCGQHKLTPEKRAHLLKIYIEKGFYAAKPVAESYGISPRYLAKMARKNGYFNNFQSKYPTAIPRQKWTDPRWQWARERGAVRA